MLLGVLAATCLGASTVAAGSDPTAARVELGRLLFFDRILSRDAERACADCHKPELAFTDGHATASPLDIHASAPAFPRNTPTLYNVASRQRLFWDRRAPSLEVQAFGPLFSPAEMGADPAALLARLRATPEYVRRFDEAFDEVGEAAVTLGNLASALASFERTLVSRDSRYDRWAAGERDALDAAELRGLQLFRSLNTRCFECHRPPSFDAPLALGIGVVSDDPGVAGVTGNRARFGHFAVPSLRNVARTAPYMHDGSIGTLEEVIDFYRKGGGRPLGVERARVNSHIRAFEIADSEAADLVAFLRALTDESGRPRAPDAVPSGLVVPGAPSGSGVEEARP